jgi:hypothetical protein
MLAYGFLNLINLHEKLTVELYDWISSGHEDASSGMALTSSIQSSLCSPLSLDGVSETQQVDILITQQWLQATMWRLTVNHCLPKLPGSQGMLPFHLPISVGKSVMEVLTSVSQSSIDSHGIGMVGWNDSDHIHTIFVLTNPRRVGAKTFRRRYVRWRCGPLSAFSQCLACYTINR